MVRPIKPVNDDALKQWLTEFKNKKTRQVYCSALRAFKKNLKIEDLGEYLKSEIDGSTDIKLFVSSLEGRPATTVKGYVAAVRVFFQDHNLKMEENNWIKLRRRGFIPKRVRTETRDKKPTKKMLKQILNYADIKAR